MTVSESSDCGDGAATPTLAPPRESWRRALLRATADDRGADSHGLRRHRRNVGAMPDVVVIWEAPSICSVNPTTWHGKLVAPVKTISFCHISRKITGQWYLSMEPRGWDGHPRWLIDYSGPDVAKKHAEAWARVNWKRIMRTDEVPVTVYGPSRQQKTFDLDEGYFADFYGEDSTLKQYEVVRGRYRRR